MHSYKSYIREQADFKVLYKNFVFVLGHIFEAAYCCNVLTNEETGICTFDNDPTCGIVNATNDWCLVGGDSMVLKTFKNRTLWWIDELKDIHDLRIVQGNTVQVLIDPWSEMSSIWEMGIDIARSRPIVDLRKIKDFNDYKDQPYTDEVVW